MTKARNILAAIIVLGLTAGYAASQYAYATGTILDYTKRVDTPAMSRLALLALLVIVVFGFIREREADDS